MAAKREISLPTADGSPDLASGSILFIGTATVLIRYAGFTILTDPNFLHKGEQVRLGYGLRSTRRTEPAMDIGELPPLDLVVLSHLHEDHFDRVAERELDRTVPIVTTGHAAAALARKGFGSTHGLATWESVTVARDDVRLRVTSMPAKHGPDGLEKLLPSAMGSMLEFRGPTGTTTLRMYISGDTLVHENLKEIPVRHPGIDLALLHLGGTRIMGILLTMDAAQGVEVIKILAPDRTIPIHFDDYTVFRSPLEDFQAAVRASGLDRRVSYVRHGDTHTIEVPASRLA